MFKKHEEKWSLALAYRQAPQSGPVQRVVLSVADISYYTPVIG